MSNTTIFIIAGVILLAIFFLIARLAIRWAIRVAIIGIVLVALLGGGGFWWWSSRLAPKPKPRPQSAPTKRASLQ
jgi:predicted benzoate:H+ symporter BenE